MLFAYETERLLLKIIKPDQADAVLDFYMRDKELFEKFEPDRCRIFIPASSRDRCSCLSITWQYRERCSGFYVYEKEHPERIIGTICVHHYYTWIF